MEQPNELVQRMSFENGTACHTKNFLKNLSQVGLCDCLPLRHVFWRNFEKQEPMPAGRPSKPLEQHELDGTYRPDRHGAEPIRAQGFAIKPEDLDGYASDVWDFIIEDLNRTAVAGKVDSVTLAEGCRWYGRYRRFSIALDSDKVSDDPDEVLKLVKVVATCWEKFANIAMRFGLTPVDRMRLKVAPEAKKRGIVSRMRKQA
jgi:P27 family predicted phage terminase small subunit